MNWVWLVVAVFLFAVSPAAGDQCPIPIETIKAQMIAESIGRYPGTCACPYQSDRAGRRCGKRSAWNRPGGYAPLCFPSDITPDMVREFCDGVVRFRQGS